MDKPVKTAYQAANQTGMLDGSDDWF